MISMKVLFRMKQQLPEQELRNLLAQLVEIYKKVPGLKQKNFIVDPKTGEVGGIYTFEDQDALDTYLKSDVYKDVVLSNSQEEPKVEIFNIIAATDAGVLL